MLESADTGRRVFQLARLLLGEPDQVVDRADGKTRVDREHIWAGCQNGDGRERCDGVVIELVQRRIDRMRDGYDQKRIAVRRRIRRSFGPDHAPGSPAVIDKDLLPQTLAELAGNETPDHVIAAAGRERNNQTHRSSRIILSSY